MKGSKINTSENKGEKGIEFNTYRNRSGRDNGPAAKSLQTFTVLESYGLY
jgi:hypothetical protein